jgi:uncharacterized protein (TIGR03083 family)
MSDVRTAYEQAAFSLADMVAGVRSDQWDAPALGVWNVRDLVGHASGGLLTVEQFSQVVSERIELQSPVGYYRKAMAGARVNETIAERGRQRGAALGNHPARVVRELAERVTALVRTLPDDHPMGTNIGGIRLIDYLPSRLVELVVHTLDIAHATSQQASPPSEAMAITLHLLADLAIASGKEAEFALGATGRELANSRFSVIG